MERANYYTLKFKRAQKERPRDWIIVPDDRGVLKLVKVPT